MGLIVTIITHWFFHSFFTLTAHLPSLHAAVASSSYLFYLFTLEECFFYGFITHAKINIVLSVPLNKWAHGPWPVSYAYSREKVAHK